MLAEAVLDLDAVDLVARAVDHVLEAVVDREVTVLVQAAEVARAPEAARESLRAGLGRLPVAGHDHRAADPDLAGSTARHVAPFRIDDPELGAGHRQADRAGAARGVVRRHDRRGRGGLGRAIEVHEPEAGQAARRASRSSHPASARRRRRRSARRRARRSSGSSRQRLYIAGTSTACVIRSRAASARKSRALKAGSRTVQPAARTIASSTATTPVTWLAGTASSERSSVPRSIASA